MTWSGIVNDTSALVPVLWHLGYLTFENPTSLRLPNIEVTSVLKNAIYPYYLKSLRESYPLIWSELDKSLENISDYFEKIQTLAIPEFNREFQET